MTKNLSIISILSIISACAPNPNVWETAPACKPIPLSSDIYFQLVRWSRGAEDRQQERIRICAHDLHTRICEDVVEYEAGLLPRVTIAHDAIEIDAPENGLRIINGKLNFITKDSIRTISITVKPIPRTNSADQFEVNEKQFGLNESPNYTLVC